MQIECGTVFNYYTGNLLQPMYEFSLQDCINSCQQYQYQATRPCVAVSFNNTSPIALPLPQNNCFLYGQVTAVIHGDTRIDSARIVGSSGNYTYAGVTDYCSANYLNSTAFTGGGTAAATNTSATGIVTQDGTNVITPIGPQTNAAAANTAATQPTTATTPPTTTPTQASNTANQGTFTASSAASPISSLCVADNSNPPNYSYNHQEVEVGGSNYEVECRTTMGGVNLIGTITVQPNLQQCIAACSSYNAASPSTQCIAVTWAANNPSGQNCALYPSIGTISYGTSANDFARMINSAYQSVTDCEYTANGQCAPSPTKKRSVATDEARWEWWETDLDENAEDVVFYE